MGIGIALSLKRLCLFPSCRNGLPSRPNPPGVLLDIRSTDDDAENVRRATAPPGISQARDNAIGHLNPPGDEHSDDGLEEGGCYNNARLLGGEHGRSESERIAGEPEGGEDGEAEAKAAGGAAGEEGSEGEGEEEGDGEPPFEEGSFFFKVDDKDKGHYKVRDVSLFLLTSMYKRKDRVTRTAGVSLLVGKLEDPPHEEKVISALFDTDRFTEKAAAQWWEDNGHRFEDARSLAAKKVGGERKNHSIRRTFACTDVLQLTSYSEKHETKGSKSPAISLTASMNGALCSTLVGAGIVIFLENIFPSKTNRSKEESIDQDRKRQTGSFQSSCQ